MNPAIPFFLLIFWIWLGYARLFGKLDAILGEIDREDGYPFLEFTIFFFVSLAIPLWGAYLCQ